jgi:L-fuconolactonase
MPRYAGPIVDAHHHLWRFTGGSHPWLAAPGCEALARDFVPHDYRRAFGGFPIIGSVWIEALAALSEDELRQAEDLHRQDRALCNALVAHVPLDAPDVEDRLDRFQARFPALRGIRDIVSAAPGRASFARSADLLRSAAFRRGLEALRDRELSFDLMLLPHQLAAAAALLERVDGLQVAVEHAGSPEDQSSGGLRQWRRNLRRIARLPSTIVKVSALQVLDPGWTQERLAHRVLDPLLDMFGADRLCFGSDFPAHDLACPAAIALDTFLDLTSGWTEPQQRAFFLDTASRFYRIFLPQPQREMP